MLDIERCRSSILEVFRCKLLASVNELPCFKLPVIIPATKVIKLPLVLILLVTSRYDSNSGGEREIQRTMLELLNQLDGFDSKGDVKVSLCPVLSVKGDCN